MFAGGIPTKLPVAVVDNDNTSTSRNLIRQMDAMQMTNIILHLNSFKEAEHEMKKGNIFAFVIIPKGLQAGIMANRQPELAFYYNNTYFVAGSLLFKDLSMMSAMASASVGLSTGLAQGKTAEAIMGQLQPIVVDSHLIGNPYLNYSVYLSNVLMPGILQLMIILITAFAIGIELKERTSREWLIMSDKFVMVALTGKLFPYTVIFTTLVIFQNVILFRILGFPLHNSIINMLAASVLFVLASQAIGIFIIGTLPVLKNAMGFSSVFGILGFTYSGFTFPVEQMPIEMQALAQFFPMQHFFKIYQNSALNGASIDYYWTSYLALIAFLLLPYLVLIRLKKAMIHLNYPSK
jgi:ABC-2 type transport system permease protein